MQHLPAGASERPRWHVVLRALREARGVTQDGWAAWLGYSRATVQRWERGDATPTADAEAAIVSVCEERGLFRTFESGPLAGLSVTPAFLRALLADARLASSAQAGAPAATTSAAPAQLQPAPVATASPAANLPRMLSSFIGRTAELAEVRRLLATTRLLTLTGAGGIGKTRLALAALERLPDGLVDDVRVVELAALSDAALVERAVASAFGIEDQPGRPLADALPSVLGDRLVLLLLDNCEHLASACATLAAALLGQCPGLRVLATSRAPLAVPGEIAWRVPALEVGDWGTSTPPLAAGTPDAARLFEERARAARPGFALSERTAPVVGQICRRLDGIPLAIELAAARVKVLAVDQIAARLDDRFRLLTSTPRGGTLPRHQTLRAVMDWSHDLLTTQEQALLRRLSVFAGGCGLEAAESVCTAEPVEMDSLLDHLSSLVDQSMLVAEVQGEEARYRLPETVRQYAAERLAASGESAEMHRRHALWLRDWAVGQEPELRGPRQAEIFARMEREYDNIRAALGWCATNPEFAAVGLHLAAALRLFWIYRGHGTEGRRWLVQLLEAGHNAPATVRAQALDGAAALAHGQGDLAAARGFQEQALVLWRELDEPRGLAIALNTLGLIARSEGDLARGLEALEEALGYMRQIGNEWGAATVLNNLGATAIELGQLDRARVYHSESLETKRRLGDRAGIAVSLHNLSEIAKMEGDTALVAELTRESLALWRALDSKPRIAHALHSLGMARLRLGDVPRAVSHLRESLTLFQEVDDRGGIAMCLEGAAALLAAAGQPGTAARLLGAAEALRERLGVPLLPTDRADYDHAVEQAQAGMDEQSFRSAWAAGRLLTPDEAIAEATRPIPAID